MPLIELILLLAGLVLLSNILSHYLVAIPVSLLQVGLGLIVALIFKTKITLDTSWFLLAFIAPLLYNDGRHFPKQELWQLRSAIFANAIILVFVTTILGGFLMHLLIPSVPLSVAFALAAILSPTDPVAVQSISQGVKLPPQILHLVSGERLINDASGLIAFKYAIAATVTGIFEPWNAVLDFLKISFLGLMVGLVLMELALLIMDWLRREGINDIVFTVVLQILIPFVIYYVAEELLHASGVIAVVAAGVFGSAQNGRGMDDQPELRLVTEKVWSIIVYLLNGIIFVILGIELPAATSSTIQTSHTNTLHAVFDVLVVWGILLVIRVVWTWAYMALQRLRKSSDQRPSWRIAALSGLSGVRGAITLAGVFTIPAVISGGQPFPERNLVLFIAAGVIITSLIAASAMLPLIAERSLPLVTRGSNVDDDDDVLNDPETDPDNPDQPDQLSYEAARIYILRMAMQRIEESRRPDNQRTAYDLILDHQFQVRRLEAETQSEAETESAVADETQLRQVALDGERQAIKELLANGEISKKSAKTYWHRIEQREHRLSQLTAKNALPSLHSLQSGLARLWHGVQIWFSPQSLQAVKAENAVIERATSKAAIKALSRYLKRADVNEHQFDRQAIYHLIVHYRNRIERAKNANSLTSDEYQQQMRWLRVKSLNAQRSGVQSLVETGQISLKTAAELRQYINYSENILMLNTDDDSEDV